VKRFVLVRHADSTGISGTGRVAEGVQFTDGRVVLRWQRAGTSRPEHVKPTTVLHDDIDSVIGLHGHDGDTEVIWMDDSPNTHVYLSTSCLHGMHLRCTEKGAECKFCATQCICQCHKWEE
jgi:hypothetical protein